MYVYLCLKYPAIYFHPGLLPSAAPWLLSWLASRLNYRYTNQAGRGFNNERRSPLISDFKKSYRKYCELWCIISDTLAGNQDVLKSGKYCSAFLRVSPGVESTEGSLCLFCLGEEGEYSHVHKPGNAYLPEKPCLSML